jgi:hypothetical protein
MPPSRRSQPLRRRGARLEQRERFLVYAEGDVSEMTYLKGVRSELGRSGPNIVIGTTHGEPLGLVRDAVAHQRRDRQQGDGFDHVWCVFDVECPKPHERLEEAIALANRNGIKCGITNPCFELWLILHFEDHRGWLTTEQAGTRAETLPFGYDRRSKDFIYEQCCGQRDLAASRADALGTRAGTDMPLRDRNPWTSVQELFREFQRSVRVHP